jgi:protoporphyrinogen oxidase
MSNTSPPKVGIIGAGPAGLTAAYLLAKQGIQAVVFEADARYVGGISKTVEHNGYRFDIGGHRFFSKSREVEALWTEILGDDMQLCGRKSRIRYRGGFFSYPLKPFEALQKLGPTESLLCVLSFLQAKLLPNRDPKNFEEWVANQFGARLFEIFFKHYTEKVWGMKCTEISADWAAQRIKKLSLWSALTSALPWNQRLREEAVHTTLIEVFRYPKRGPGQLWEVCADKFQKLGGTLHMDEPALRVEKNPQGGWTIITQPDSSSQKGIAGHVPERRTHVDHVIGSAPLRQTIETLQPPPPAHVLEAARQLRYRDFIAVALMTNAAEAFDDNWIYVQEPHVKVGRIQNFRAWSEGMVPPGGGACYGMEYFCFEGDGLWTSRDEDLIALAKRELEELGLLPAAQVTGGYVVRQPKAYPVYDHACAQNLAILREYLRSSCPGLHQVGRNGLHRYNNQDHSMMTAMLTVKNIIGPRQYDVWCVNQDAEYHEEGEHGGHSDHDVQERLVPGAAA